MKSLQILFVTIVVLTMTNSRARAQQGQPLAKIRVDEKGNVEVLDLDITPKESTQEYESPTNQIQRTPFIQVSEPLQPASSHNICSGVSSFGSDLTYVPSQINYSFSPPDLTIQVRVKNQGSMSAGASQLGYYLSTDMNINKSDTKLGTDAVPSLSAGAASTQTITADISGHPGTWYVGFIIDELDAVSESDENNNDKALSPTISNLPDLDITGFVVSSSPIFAFIYWFSVKNYGYASTGNGFKNFIYLSPDLSLDPSDHKIDELSADPLDKDKFRTTSGQFSYSELAAIPGGEYYVFVEVDANNDIVELDENNNIEYDNIRKIWIPESHEAELRPYKIEVINTEGSQIEYNYSVKNKGYINTGSGFMNYIYLCANKTTYPFSGNKIDEQSCGPLAPEEVYNSGNIQTTFSGVPAGEYYLAVFADGDDVISEFDENNNIIFTWVPEIIVSEPSTPRPDLIVTSVSVIDESGPEIAYQYSVKNQGDGSTERAFANYIYLSPDQTINSNDYKIDEQQCSELSAGDTYNSGSIQTTVSGVPAGDYYLGVEADGGLGTVDESEEGNNFGYCSDPKVTIPEPPATQPDLIVTSVTVTDSAGPQITCQYSVQNQGDASTGSGFKNYIYLSPDQTITSSDHKIEEESSSALSAGSTYNSGSIQTTVNGVPAGNYYLGVMADGNSEIAESNESNNTGYDDTPLVNIPEAGESEEPVEPEEPEGNLISNWNFDKGTDDWYLNIQGGAQAEGSVQNGEYQTSITKGGSENWHIQFLQHNLLIKKGSEYLVSFDAYADSQREIFNSVTKWAHPWTVLSNYESFALTTTKQQFYYNFLMTEPTTSQGALVFALGMSTANVYLDNISLVEISSSTDIAPEESRQIVKTCNLFQNYPNPFNPVTTIRYTVPKTCHVILTIYDLLGRQVTTLVNETITAGEYSVRWSGQDNPAGIYLAHLTAGEFTDTKKLILQK